MINPLAAMPGGWELVLIALVILLLFGARKLPELARGTGQALRIFKAETKGLKDDEKDDGAQENLAGERPEPTPRAELPPAPETTEPGPDRQADQHRN